MKNWLNSVIGVDGATYIGVAIGLVALIYGGKKIYSKVSQKQTVKNGTGIQIGGNANIGNESKSKH